MVAAEREREASTWNRIHRGMNIGPADLLEVRDVPIFNHAAVVAGVPSGRYASADSPGPDDEKLCTKLARSVVDGGLSTTAR